jgi:hypothetical protein
MDRSIQPLAKLKMGWSIECPAKLKMDPMPSKTQNERTSKNTEYEKEIFKIKLYNVL